MIRSHRDLIVWQKSMTLAVQCYRLTRQLPISERYGLALQMRRSATSIPSNIAEGVGRHRRGEYARFLAIARGSARELDTQLELAVLGELISDQTALPSRSLLDEVCRMLTTMLRRLDASDSVKRELASRLGPARNS